VRSGVLVLDLLFGKVWESVVFVLGGACVGLFVFYECFCVLSTLCGLVCVCVGRLSEL